METHGNAIEWAAGLAKLGAIVLIVVLANFWVSWLIDRLEIQIWPEYLEIVNRTVLIGVALYTALMATPFLPAIEIGLALMLVLGIKGVVVIYVCTLVALTISFGLGRVLPAHLLVSLLRWLSLGRAAKLLETFDATPAARRLDLLAGNTQGRIGPALLRRRYLLLAVLLNLPGNALLGGGGGIAMMAGMSRIYSFPAYLSSIVIGTLPGPILLMLSKYLL